jgi:hypothetical protein
VDRLLIHIDLPRDDLVCKFFRKRSDHPKMIMTTYLEEFNQGIRAFSRP